MCLNLKHRASLATLTGKATRLRTVESRFDSEARDHASMVLATAEGFSKSLTSRGNSC